jgi:chromosome segregation ATPase
MKRDDKTEIALKAARDSARDAYQAHADVDNARLTEVQQLLAEIDAAKPERARLLAIYEEAVSAYSGYLDAHLERINREIAELNVQLGKSN